MLEGKAETAFAGVENKEGIETETLISCTFASRLPARNSCAPFNNTQRRAV